MPVEMTGPALPPASQPGGRGRVPRLRPRGAGGPAGRTAPAGGADGVSISPQARAMAALAGMEEVRPDVAELAAAVLDGEGRVLDEAALRAGVQALLRVLGTGG